MASPKRRQILAVHKAFVEKDSLKKYLRNVESWSLFWNMFFSEENFGLDRYAPESLSQLKKGWDLRQQLFSGQLLKAVIRLELAFRLRIHCQQPTGSVSSPVHPSAVYEFGPFIRACKRSQTTALIEYPKPPRKEIYVELQRPSILQMQHPVVMCHFAARHSCNC